MKARERRYSRYKAADVWDTMYEQQFALGFVVEHDTVIGNTVSLVRGKQRYRAIVLARSSDWYRYSLNTDISWKHRHGITLILCGTHDSCLPVPVQALDHPKWYEPRTTRLRVDTLAVQHTDADGYPDDAFDKTRRTMYGHSIFIGALMCGREDAIARLATMRESTVFRIKAELKHLHRRRGGRPIAVPRVVKRKEQPVVKTETTKRRQKSSLNMSLLLRRG